MFGTQTRVFAIAGAVLLCAVASFAANDFITAEFVETVTGKPNATTNGKLYYYYDSTTPANSRLRFEYSLPGKISVIKLYNYTDDSVFSMCTGKTCTGIYISEDPDPWYPDSATYNQAQNPTTGSYYWYTRKTVTGQQVKRILMNQDKAAANPILKIEFNDGRILDIKNSVRNPNGYNANHAKFKIESGYNCPKPNCPLYADIVFVLDNSGSVNGTEWTISKDFVRKLLGKYEFGPKAVEAAVIQFQGNYKHKNCKKKVIDECKTCYTDHEFKTYSVPNKLTAKIIAGKSDSVTYDFDSLNKSLNNKRPESHGTCQGFGLQLAMSVFDKSPRNKNKDKPNRIVIVVTDGQDFCPVRTTNAANKLKKNYGAFIFEVGVGIPSCGKNYHQTFLKGLASSIGSANTTAYYDVKNYDKVKEMSDILFKPICRFSTSDCGSACHGFCGCANCYCPYCNDTGSYCYNNTCKTDGKSSTGCESKEVPCPKGDICTSYVCQGDKSGNERCRSVSNPCTEKKNQYPGKCREVLCNPSKGGCYVQVNDVYCQKQFGNACLQYECTPLKEKPVDSVSGCRVKVNKTKDYQAQLDKNGKGACFAAKCDPITGNLSEVPSCKSKNDLCYTAECKQDDKGTYKCEQIDKNRPNDTVCHKYQCDATKGWIATATSCAVCTLCDTANGCKKVEGCYNCDSDKKKKCIAQGIKSSNSSYCVYGFCTNKAGSCNVIGEIANCLETMAKAAEEMNKAHPDKCYTPACGSTTGLCTLQEVPSTSIPKEFKQTKCMRPVCQKQKDGSWDWGYGPTEVNETCKSDACCFRECRDDEGCHEEDICMNRTTECETYSCVVSAGKPAECKVTKLQLEETECTREVCNASGIKIWVDKDLNAACPPPDKCHEPVCVNDTCSFVEKVSTEEDDVCNKYVCNPATGSFDKIPVCDDGEYCTEDICDVFGECSYEPIICSEKIAMEGYPCFEAICKEGEGKYKCERKLIHDAYIDVCGNCIVVKDDENTPENDDDNGSETSGSEANDDSSSRETNDASSIDFLECTGAPPRPLLTEGLAAASIALIIIAAVVGGVGLTASGVITTKTLIDRAKQADNQSAHTNPLYQTNDTEMSNPAFSDAA